MLEGVTDPRVEYERRLRVWRERIAAHDRRHLVTSNVRLMVAAAIALLVWLAFFRRSVSPWWLVAAAAGFAALVVFHARVLQQLERSRRAARLYERGLDRLGGRWAGLGRGGEQFQDDHPYARDLDLFGRGSVFELLNTARTEAGESTLAGWLRSGAGVEEVAARQAAVGELRAALDFREALAVLAAEGEVSRTGSIATWSGLEPLPIPRHLPLLFAACSIVTIALAVAAANDVIPWSLVVGWLLLVAAIIRGWRRALNAIAERIGYAAHDLALVAELMLRIETEQVRAERLAALQSALSTNGVSASRAIARLTRLVSWRESSLHNLLFMPVTSALLVPEQFAIAINRWQATCGAHVPVWLRVVGELEALSALANYAYEHPADPFPVVVGNGPVFRAEGLRHPLLSEAIAVPNDVHLGGADGLRAIVVSGSNMSGKSTVLRSVGVNTVLALAGGPVRAAQLTVSPLLIGATLRIDDSLQAGHSRFYTEILRLRAIVEAARGPVPLLFLLDEILHGTNSHDRRIGAEAIVRALVGAGAIGLVTTHDLALTQLPARLGAAATNMHFQDRIDGGTMVFDYRMRPGIVEHSNALALMRAVGLEV
jgi:MutS-like protein